MPAKLSNRLPETREFVAWDGEGYTDDNGEHHYYLFGASTGDIVGAKSLGTADCLELLLMVERAKPEAYHVIFAGNYDVNMILKDVSLEALQSLKATGICKWKGYRLEYRKGKMFRVSRNGESITLFDVFTFFQTSFVKAIAEYLGDAYPELITIIEQGKQARGTFTYDDSPDVKRYMEAELSMLVKLCNRLRELLIRAGIVITKWHGPGAVANTILKAKSIRRTELPNPVKLCGQHAYSGGRFEQFRIGRASGQVYQYDIRSAYPAAIAELPQLGGDWVHERTPLRILNYSLYHVVWNIPDVPPWFPYPFPWRRRNGAIYYPHQGATWIWGCELNALPDWVRRYVRVIEGWVYEDNGTRPFGWISEMYERRAEWKRQGEPAQLALKLGMNSIYGKLAQQIGWRITKGELKLPPNHQLEHAGFVTAFARSKLYPAMIQAEDGLIACETDAVYSSRQLKLDIGPGLGQWEEEQYEDIVYVQSGVYWALSNGKWKTRSRGFGRTDVSVSDVLSWFGNIRDIGDAASIPALSVNQTRFKTLGVAIGKPVWRRWVTETRELHAGLPGGKREHFQCRLCGTASLADGLHDMQVAQGVDFSQFSTAYPLLWKDAPLESMEEYERFRDEGVELWEL